MIALNVLDKDGNPVALNTVDGAVLEKLLASPSLATNFSTGSQIVAFSAKATAGKLLAVHATSANAAARYLQIFNTPAAPSVGATPLYAFPIAAGTAAAPGGTEKSETFFGAGGAAFASGISIAVSTTLLTYTAATATDHVVHAHYV